MITRSNIVGDEDGKVDIVSLCIGFVENEILGAYYGWAMGLVCIIFF